MSAPPHEAKEPILAPEDGIDRSAIRELLKLTYAERARLAVEEARNLALFDELQRSSQRKQ